MLTNSDIEKITILMNNSLVPIKNQISGMNNDISAIKKDITLLKKSSNAELKGINAILIHLLSTEEIVNEQIESLQKRTSKLEQKTV